ncbi:hypothetical protein [uncultured Gordonia sp.]|uniref:hypothetical protein n=1 Tax=uncultured Gordonia sp. TaxID=198437 RepID=UPI00258AB50C|nr:hypothetical protein [uncultured Gordonia sp.]
MHRSPTLSTYLGAIVFALALYLVPLGALAACVHLGWYADPEPQPAAVTMSVTPGDDNGDGIIDEDESGWDCATMGNQVCGPILDSVGTPGVIA